MKRFLIAALAMFALAALAPTVEAGGLLRGLFAPRVAVVGGNAVAVRAPFVNVGVGRQFVAVAPQRVFVQRQFVQPRVIVQRQFVPSHGVQQFGFAPVYSGGGFQSSFGYSAGFAPSYGVGGCGALLGY